ncbi:MAG: helix-turn-helix domain-containing protein, partial [Pirellula sp.]
MVESGSFREDLLFRINAFEIHVPPLRQRVEDVVALARYLYLRHHPEHASLASIFSPETMELLLHHPWPGNVRELANVIEHATILCEYPPILPEHLPRHLVERKLRRDIKVATEEPAMPAVREQPRSLKELEVLAVQEAVQRHNGNKAAAAEELGISIKTLYNKLNSAEANIKRVA